MNKLTIKIILTVLMVGLSIFFLYPTWDWYRMPDSERDTKVKMKDPSIGKILNLGLDLRGGTHLLMELDPSKLEAGTDINDALDRAISIIRNRVDAFGVAEPLIARQG